jgi:hypothetical protein
VHTANCANTESPTRPSRAAQLAGRAGEDADVVGALEVAVVVRELKLLTLLLLLVLLAPLVVVVEKSRIASTRHCAISVPVGAGLLMQSATSTSPRSESMLVRQSASWEVSGTPVRPTNA